MFGLCLGLLSVYPGIHNEVNLIITNPNLNLTSLSRQMGGQGGSAGAGGVFLDHCFAALSILKLLKREAGLRCSGEPPFSLKEELHTHHAVICGMNSDYV